MSTAPAPGSADSPLVRRQLEEDDRITEALFEAVEWSGVDVDRSDECLYTVLDGDALNRLFTANGGVQLEFRLWGRHVVVHPSEIAVYQ